MSYVDIVLVIAYADITDLDLADSWLADLSHDQYSVISPTWEVR